jgi:single-strand DNA-binding protein
MEGKTMNNQITIVGHVGQNPKAVTFPSGKSVVKFSVAVKEFSNANEEPTTLWLDVDAWNGYGERVLKSITKGREVVVTGRLAVETFTSTDDPNHTITKPVIKLISFHLCGKKPEAASQPEAKDETSKKTRKSSAA